MALVTWNAAASADIVLCVSTRTDQSPRASAMVHSHRTAADNGSPATIVYASTLVVSYSSPLASTRKPSADSTVSSLRPVATSRESLAVVDSGRSTSVAAGGAPSAGANGGRAASSGRGGRTGRVSWLAP